MGYNIKYLIINEDFIKNMPSDLLAELINFDDVIPDGIQSPLYRLNETFNEERKEYIDNFVDDPDNPFIVKSFNMRYGWRPDDFDDRVDSIALMNEEEIKQACEFIIEYPKYACLLKSIEYYYRSEEDSGREFLYEEPFDVYLEKYIKEKESNN